MSGAILYAMNEVDTRPEAKLPDADALEVGKPGDTQEEKEDKLVSLWKTRFDRSENFRRPYIARNIRMYKLYRAYRDATNYAYGTRLMPPTGFEIIETVKPRLASAEITVNIYPTKMEDKDKTDNIAHWDDLIEYDLQVMEFDDKKILWINAMLTYGNGTAQLMWEGDEDGDPFLEIVDNFLLYPDPKATNRLKDSDWEIKQSFKSKAQIEKAEKARGDNPLYTVMEQDEEDGVYKPVSLIKSKKWKDIEEGKGLDSDDPRRQRYEINTLKMGQISDGRAVGQGDDAGPGSSTTDKNEGEKLIEIWECWDHVEGKLQAVFNRTTLVRDEDNPYADVNDGRVFIDLCDISLNWEYYAMGHLEPVETTIHEIADSRNQAMDDIVFSLDPIRKVKKGAGYKDSDFKHSPGAIWYVQKADDVVIERAAEVSRVWIEKDNILRREIESSLAMSEYVRGVPKSGQEPMGKVELLLMQTNIRFSLLVRQMEIAYTDLVNGLIQLNKKMLGEKKSMRILGKNFRFAEFTAADKEVEVDAKVDIVPKKEKSAEQESKEVLEMYKLFVVDDKPEGDQPVEVLAWKKKKNLLQRLIVEKLGYEEYADILAPKEAVKSEAKPEVKVEEPEIPAVMPPSGPAEGLADNPVPLQLKQAVPEPADMLPLESAIPGADTPQTAPSKNLLARLMRRLQGKR